MKVTTIFGPPGTGKTRKLVDFAKEEDSALFLSYTKAAAEEAVSRLRNTKLRPSTLHSLAFNSLGMNRASVVDRAKLKLFSAATGYPFKGVDNSDEEEVGDQYLEVISYSRNRLMLPMEAYERFGAPGTRKMFERFISEYEQWKQTYGYMDFDDMLTLYSRQGKSHARVVFLDEAQDCTPLQWSAFERAVEHAQRVYLAGDDDQAVYEWNGADPHGMINFNNRNNGDIIVLEISHRLPRLPFLKSVELLKQVEKRQEKVWTHADREGKIVQYRDMEFVADRLAKIAPKGALVLVRDRWKLKEVQHTLNREMIPYEVYGGMSPWTSKLARSIVKGEAKWQDAPPHWQDFYREADLKQDIKYFLSTVHSAKGREHETVIVDLDMPARVLMGVSRDRDAEVRVQYVSLTRTKNELILCGGNPIV